MPGVILSIIIVNWNGKRFLKGCFDSIYRQKVSSIEVIFVDNGSTDGSIEFVRENFPQTVIVENGQNLGFAAANNRGILKARGKYIATLNNDTELKGAFIEKIISAAEGADKSVGMWAPKILSLDERDVIDSVGGLLIYPDGLAKGRGRLEKDRGQYDSEEVFIPSACAAVYRKKMLDEIGLFDEDFFAYCEDTDLGMRARLAGWGARGVPEAVVYHYYSGTGGKYTPLKAYLVERNRLWVALKNFPPPILVLAPLYTLWRYIIQTYGIIAKKGAGGRFTEDFSKKKLIGILIRAYVDALKGIPKALDKRKIIQKRRKARNREILRWFERFRLSAKELVLKD